MWGTGGDTGFTRDGSHAELISIPVEALARKPERLSFDEASTVGVNFVVGWYGAVETAQLAAGETIAIFGVSGGVGGAVAQIARAVGAKVIGVDRHPPGQDTPAAAVIDHFVAFDPAADVGAEIKRLTGGAGVEVVYDAVGGVTTPAALACARAARQARGDQRRRARAPSTSICGICITTRPGFSVWTVQNSASSTPRDASKRWGATSNPGSFSHFPSPPAIASTRRSRPIKPSPTASPAASSSTLEGGKDMSSNLTEETITEAVQRTFDTSTDPRFRAIVRLAWCSTCMTSRVTCG